MPKFQQPLLPKIIQGLLVLLILKVTLSVVWNYRHYLPPDFDNEFLQGRQSYFFGSYQWAFYSHLISGPLSLLLGLLLLSDRFRQAFPTWHRNLGKVQLFNILLLVVPSGFWMALFAQPKPIASTGFAALALFTGIFAALGWKAALNRQFSSHRVWMCRTYMLLGSAVVIRIIGGLATVTDTQAEWIYPASAWASWLLPLASYELYRLYFRRLALTAM